MKVDRKRLLAGIAALLVAAIGLLNLSRQPQAAPERLSYDGVRYYAGAISILETGRYLDLDGEPQQIWPPGLSLLYAGLSSVTGDDPTRHVRGVGMVSYLAMMTALYAAARLLTLRWWTTALLLSTVGWNGFYLSVHDKLWSEPPALPLLIGALLCVLAAAQMPRRAGRLLAAACVLLSIAMVFRMAAVAAVPLVFVAAIALRRWAIAALVLLTPVPTLIAMSLLGASRGNRDFRLQPIAWEQHAHAYSSLGEQFLPNAFGGAMALVPLVILILAAVAARFPLDDRGRAVAGAAVWTATYAAFLPVTQLLAAPPPIVDLRMLLPLFPPLVLAACAALDLAVEHRRLFPAALLATILLVSTIRAGRYVAATMTSGPIRSARRACVSREWYISTIRRMDPRGTIVTNAPGTVWLALRRPVRTTGPADTTIRIDARTACPSVVDYPEMGSHGNVHTQNGLSITTRAGG